MSKYLIILLVAFALYGCGSDPVEIMEPSVEIMEPSCEYSVGDVVEITLYETGVVEAFNVSIAGCDNPVIITLSEASKGKQFTIGDVVKVRITNKKSQFSYEGDLVD